MPVKSLELKMSGQIILRTTSWLWSKLSMMGRYDMAVNGIITDPIDFQSV
jgi:hypothetical protein